VSIAARVSFLHLIALVIALVGATPISAKTVRVAVISDLNGSYGSLSYDARIPVAIERIIALNPDLVIATGDLVAGQRRPLLPRDTVRAMWAAFHETVTDPLTAAHIPLAVTPGNHDASGYDGFQMEREIFADEWKERRPDVEFVEETGFPFQYAFKFDDVLFVSIDATTVGHLGSKQMEDLSGILGRNPADVTIAFSHLPLWPFAQNRESEIIGDPALEDMFHRYDVDMHLNGHHHTYYPGHKDGIDFISQACLGSGRRRLISDTARSPHSFTMLEKTDQGHIEVSAFTGRDFTQTVDIKTLPTRIDAGSVTLIRRDLVE